MSYIFKTSDLERLSIVHEEIAFSALKLDNINLCRVEPRAFEYRKRIRVTLRKARADMRALKELIKKQ